MVYGQLILGILFFVLLHSLVWFSTNLQFMEQDIKNRSLEIAMLLSIPTTLLAYYGSKLTYASLSESVWAIRFIGFGTSWLVFPILTWVLLGESMFTPKTLICTFLALCIISVQIFYPQ